MQTFVPVPGHEIGVMKPHTNFGDWLNDVPMFAFFPNSVGVANVRDFAGRIATPPAMVQANAPTARVTFGHGVSRNPFDSP